MSSSLYLYIVLFFFFFFNDPATTEIYTLSLHDALPICGSARDPCPPRRFESSVELSFLEPPVTLEQRVLDRARRHAEPPSVAPQLPEVLEPVAGGEAAPRRLPAYGAEPE